MQSTQQQVMEYSKILRYGTCKGAPLTQRGSEMMVQQRKCSHAVLQGLISRAGLPKDVAVSILLMKGLEVDESFGYKPRE
jgi:hypothetical protein